MAERERCPTGQWYDEELGYCRTGDRMGKVTIIPYHYSSLETQFRPVEVWVIKGKESPDPFKKMLWGRTPEGIISDYKRYFTRVGRPVELTFDKTGLVTAMEEERKALEVIDEYIKRK